MFPKVIRSETITRPILPEIEDADKNFETIIMNAKQTNNEISNEVKVVEASPSDSDYIKYSEDNSNSSENGNLSAGGQMSIQKDSDSGNLSTQDNNSARSFILFSPEAQREDSDLFEVSPSATFTSSQSSQGDWGYQLYEEFMSEIPHYLRQTAPALLRDDPMDTTKSALHDLYLESCRQESEENLLNSMRKSVVRKRSFIPKEPEIESPDMDYFRISHVSRPRTEPERRTLYDTPDYTYYPHKLNQ
ncbi:hypothetical protein NE865_12860 [Phthorimaea operculella]|nr:hypothetical protein NE865_12860 [Phthorimaea operculella]